MHRNKKLKRIVCIVVSASDFSFFLFVDVSFNPGEEEDEVAEE